MLMTPFGEQLDKTNILPEYPRPQLRRDSYVNLNGPWQYAITDSDDPPLHWEGEILVPFSPESPLSGVGRTLLPGQTLWYQRSFVPPEGERVILHFGAVDQEAVVYVNGVEVCRHMGGYNAFSAEITHALQKQNTLLVQVHDDTDASFHTRGKQKTRRGGIWYTAQSGIWQTVWMEAVPDAFITGLRFTPLFAESAVEVTVQSQTDAPCRMELEGRIIDLTANQPCRVPMEDFHPWSPEDPYLYDCRFTLGNDRVDSYFAMRSVTVQADAAGTPRLFLNGKPCFHNGLLDQGYWPDGLYTPPGDQAMIFDIQTAKELGYNMLRKHIKVEPMRWYYHCDRLGMLVWQDMPNGGETYRPLTITAPLLTGRHHRDSDYRRFARQAEEGRREYLRELEEMVNQLYNCPCVVLWVPFNEGWGQFDAAKAVQLIRSLDATRPIDHASGWHDQGAGDFKSSHVYFVPYRFRRDDRGRAVILSEFGGYALRLPGHCWNTDSFGYKTLRDCASLWQAYRQLFEREILPVIPQGLCATVYTQLTDVEDECNGLITYDRRQVKLPEDELRALNQQVMQASPKA